MKFVVDFKEEEMGSDPDTDEPIVSANFFVCAVDTDGRKWRHEETFPSIYEVVTEIGRVVHRRNRSARREAEDLRKEFTRKTVDSVDELPEWDEV